MSLEKQKIIIIEDDPDHADLFIDVLEEEGIQLEIVLLKDGKEAMDYLRDVETECDGGVLSQFRMVVLDLNLPKVHGMEILKFLKGNPALSSIPVLIISTSSDQETIDEAYGNGADGYIAKPAHYDEFVNKLRTLMNS